MQTNNRLKFDDNKPLSGFNNVASVLTSSARYKEKFNSHFPGLRKEFHKRGLQDPLANLLCAHRVVSVI